MGRYSPGISPISMTDDAFATVAINAYGFEFVRNIKDLFPVWANHEIHTDVFLKIMLIP